ncbi:hypothetical protein [Flexithrix dorotheae]|uniref:hypothetical protein n=1 Tax=Flexithrix dorotheae TaxID=70993 RepID=UPI0003740189|nr:hypothetical protein [Flexithrix dorotheae]
MTISCANNNETFGTISIKVINENGKNPNCSFDGYFRDASQNKGLSDFLLYFDFVPGTIVENGEANNFTFEKVFPGTYEFEIEFSCATKTFMVNYEGGNYFTDLVIEDCPEEPSVFMASTFTLHFWKA